MVKIMIADDQQLIRESLKIILDSDPSFEVVKVVGSGQEVLDSLKTESVDIILMDVRMPNMSGVDCTRIVKKEYPNIKVIILTTFDDDEYIYDALKYGASGYLLKGCSLEELSSAIHSVLSGGACFNPNVAGKVAQFFSQMANSNSEFSFEHEDLASYKSEDLSEGRDYYDITANIENSTGCWVYGSYKAQVELVKK